MAVGTKLLGFQHFSLKTIVQSNMTKAATNLFLVFLGLRKKRESIKKNRKYLSVSRTL